ncbi:MAG: hypothetical protein LBC39_00515 [Methanobrevibacter sp.]|jgi:hypothetical protein|nr:hypothetical protein [Candidatus Methanovirga aequatorialis]
MEVNVIRNSTKKEIKNKNAFVELLRNSPIPENELLSNLPLYIPRQDFTHILLVNEIYQKILNTPGVIMEFGCRWGRNMALFETLRGIYEPYDYCRKIIGFDTFEGFIGFDEKDGEQWGGC